MQRAHSSNVNGPVSAWLSPCPGRVDQHHPVARGEVLGLRRPHVAGHQQAGPEQDRVSVACGLHPDPAQRGIDRDVIQSRVHVAQR
jgi:hypothetical protein